MDRRTFIKLLGIIPFIPLVPRKETNDLFEGVKTGLGESSKDLLSQTEQITEELARQTIYFTPYPKDKSVYWNGEKWSALEFGTEGELYIKGDFLLESPEQIQQRHLRYFEGLDESITTGHKP